MVRFDEGHLRSCKLSGRFEEFWERRAQRRVS